MKKHCQKGVTLIELIISVSLLAIIVIVSVSVLDYGNKSFKMVNESGEIQTKACYIKIFISKKVRNSTDINVTSEPHTLEMTESSGDSTRFIWDADLKTLVYENITSGESDQLTDSAENVSFIELASGVEIDIELTENNESFRFKTTVYMKI